MCKRNGKKPDAPTAGLEYLDGALELSDPGEGRRRRSLEALARTLWTGVKARHLSRPWTRSRFPLARHWARSILRPVQPSGGPSPATVERYGVTAACVMLSGSRRHGRVVRIRSRTSCESGGRSGRQGP